VPSPAIEEDPQDEDVPDFLQGYARTSFKGDAYDLTFVGAEIDYSMNLKPFDRVENLAASP
jgi:hypothetical protein